ncbi:MAG: YihY family inner membrane protein [Motiliproteus sp.]
MNSGSQVGEPLAKLQISWLFLRFLFLRFNENRGTLNAAALTYTTLFAVVPFMTVTYTVLSSVSSFQGMGQQLENLIFSHFVPSSGVAVKDYLSQFASQARTLTLVGVGFLVVTALMMMKTIESSFNHIWRVRQPRKGVASFLLYWAVLSLGPLLLGLGFALTSYLASLPMIGDATLLLERGRLLLLLPLLMSTAAFSLLYMAVPNCPVPARHAFVGGFTAALIFETAKQGFTLFVTYFPSYELIYGAFAAVPLFLAWIYISWMIIIICAELVLALSAFHVRGFLHAEQQLGLNLRILEQFWKAQKTGETVRKKSLLVSVDVLKSADIDIDSYLNDFMDSGLISRTEQGGYVLTRDLHQLSLAALCDTLPWKIPPGSELVSDRPWGVLLQTCLQAASISQQQHLDITLASLFSGSNNVTAVEFTTPNTGNTR